MRSGELEEELALAEAKLLLGEAQREIPVKVFRVVLEARLVGAAHARLEPDRARAFDAFAAEVKRQAAGAEVGRDAGNGLAHVDGVRAAAFGLVDAVLEALGGIPGFPAGGLGHGLEVFQRLGARHADLHHGAADVAAVPPRSRALAHLIHVRPIKQTRHVRVSLKNDRSGMLPGVDPRLNPLHLRCVAPAARRERVGQRLLWSAAARRRFVFGAQEASSRIAANKRQSGDASPHSKEVAAAPGSHARTAMRDTRALRRLGLVERIGRGRALLDR